MKTLLLAAMVGLAAFSARGAGVGVFGGVMDTQDFGEGRTLGAKLEADIFGILGMEIRGTYNYDFKDEGLGLEDFEMYGIEGGLRIRLPIGEFISLHAGAGGGYYIMPEFDVTMSDGRTVSSDIDDTPGLYGLVGAEVGVKNLRLFAEAKYLYLRPDLVKSDFLEQLYTPIDTDLSGISLLVGVLVRW